MLDQIIGISIGYGVPMVFALIFSLSAVAAFAFFLSKPEWPALAVFLVILLFINPSYGFIDKAPVNVYTWGRTRFFVPIFEMFLSGLFLAVYVKNIFEHNQPLRSAGGGWLKLFILMFVGHFVVAIYQGVEWVFVLNEMGLIQVVYMGMLMYIAVSVLSRSKNIESFIKVFVYIAVVRAVYGLIRFLLLGGDPQNGYSTPAGAGVKITFWDSNEGVIACLAAFYFAHHLVNEWRRMLDREKAIYLAIILLEIFVIVFSYRRTNLFGLVFAAVYFISLLPFRKRIFYAVVSISLVVPPVIGVMTYRAQEYMGKDNVGVWESITQTKSTNQSLADRGGRFYELEVASRSLEESPIFGIGSWNAFKIGYGDEISLSYHKGNYHFIHSGFGHVLLKSGILGLILFLGILVASWRYAGKFIKIIAPEHKMIFHSFRAGLWFMMPTLVLGTPVIEMRSMLWLAVILSVPIAIARFAETNLMVKSK